MNLEILKQPLKVNHIDFKVAQISKTTQNNIDTVWANILAYKDARVDMQILDEACGQLGWQVTYQRDSKGVLQCSIAIRNEVTKEWIWKTSNGTESDFESEKGEYSDAFKRAGFMWGIGRQLYDFCTIRVQLNEKDYYEKDGKIKASNWLRPNGWRWTVSEDYKSVKAERRFGTTWKEIFNSNPYKKES